MVKNVDVNQLSRFLSLILRHKPEVVKITLDSEGWVATSELIDKINKNSNHVLTLESLKYIVATNNKQRFGFNEDFSKIRANQGHSISVDLNLTDKEPPEFLYHGTATKYVNSILTSGLLKRDRQHVHLSSDTLTAKNVGARHGDPILFKVSAKQMFDNGFKFYLSENNVWLTDTVPSIFLKLIQ